MDRPRPDGELADYLRYGPAEDVGHEVEPTPVRRPYDHVLDAEFGCPVEQSLHAGDKRLAAVDAVSLGSRAPGGEEVLEQRGPDEALEHDEATVLVVVVVGLAGLDPSGMCMYS